MRPLHRRTFLFVTPAAAFGASALCAAGVDTPTSPTLSPTFPHFPGQDPAVVKEVVGLAHRDLDGVKKLVERQPALAKCAWDWAYGDWESALGAASHTGQREIALYLIEKGARPDIFTFAMLGNLPAVKAMIEGSPGSPGVQKIPGPHGIPLLAHAEAGGDAAKPVYDYLLSLGDAGQRLPAEPLADDERAKYLGVYTFGPHERDRVEIKPGKPSPLTIERPGTSPRNLFYRGDQVFRPVGAPEVRVRFIIENGRATKIEFFDPDLYLTATRD